MKRLQRAMELDVSLIAPVLRCLDDHARGLPAESAVIATVETLRARYLPQMREPETRNAAIGDEDLLPHALEAAQLRDLARTLRGYEKIRGAWIVRKRLQGAEVMPHYLVAAGLGGFGGQRAGAPCRVSPASWRCPAAAPCSPSPARRRSRAGSGRQRRRSPPTSARNRSGTTTALECASAPRRSLRHGNEERVATRQPQRIAMTPSNPWSLDQARKTYSIPHWAEGYFDVDAAGHVVVSPQGGQGKAISLPEIVDSARANGARMPLLVRFPDILGDRLGKLQAAFAQAQAEWEYPGGYTAVYPIKVNQHRGVAGTLASHHGEGFGLEAGSKPELMAVLALVAAGRADRLQRLQGSRIHPPGPDRPQAGPADLHRDREAVRAGAGDRGSQGAGREAGPRRAHAPGFTGRRQVAEQRRRQGQVRPVPAPGAGPVEVAARCRPAGHAWACCISTWARRSPTCATSPTACARPRVISSSCPSSARPSAMSMSAAASASTTKARVRAAIARSTTGSTSTPPTSCSRWPKPAKNTS